MTGQAADARAGTVLYTPELLGLAMSLASTPFDPAMPLIGEARSRTCGSTLKLSCRIDGEGRLVEPGVQVAACAVGQAAAAICVPNAIGRTRAEIGAARESIAHWLVDGGVVPDWPGLGALVPARAYPARHGAILLAWDAALAALSMAETRG